MSAANPTTVTAMKIPFDKVAHAVVGVLIAVVVMIAGGTPIMAAAGAIVIGVGKELVWDKALGRGVPDWLDAVATAGGGVFVAVVTAVSQATALG